MSFILGEFFLGLFGLSFLCLLSSLKVKSFFLVDLGLKLIIPLLLIYFFIELNLENVFVVFFNSTMVYSSIVYYYKLFFIFLIIIVYFLLLNFFVLEEILLDELSILILLSSLGSLLVIMSNDFFYFFIVLELQNIIFYVFAILKKYNTFSVEAGIKYYIFGSISSNFFLFGIVMLYGFFGTLNFFELSLLVDNFLFLDFSLVYLIFFSLFIFLGLFIKFGVVPFH